MHDLENVAIRIVKIGAVAAEGSRSPLLLVDDPDAVLGQKCLGPYVFVGSDTEGMVNVGFVAGIGIDGIFRTGQHEAVSAGLHEDHVVVPPDPAHPYDLGIELLGPVEILDRNGEMENTFGLQHFCVPLVQITTPNRKNVYHRPSTESTQPARRSGHAGAISSMLLTRARPGKSRSPVSTTSKVAPPPTSTAGTVPSQAAMTPARNWPS